MPRSVIIINWIIGISLVGGSRIIGRWWFSNKKLHKAISHINQKNVLVYGAGSAGVQLATSLSFSQELNPVAFIDDDHLLTNHQIMGLKVYPSDNLEKLIISMEIEEFCITFLEK